MLLQFQGREASMAEWAQDARDCLPDNELVEIGGQSSGRWRTRVYMLTFDVDAADDLIYRLKDQLGDMTASVCSGIFPTLADLEADRRNRERRTLEIKDARADYAAAKRVVAKLGKAIASDRSASCY